MNGHGGMLKDTVQLTKMRHVLCNVTSMSCDIHLPLKKPFNDNKLIS